jgi:2-iminobutanoate/2-iminopropanoate deaminase
VNRTQINPWSWQDAYGFSQGWWVDGAGSILFVSGQAPISPDGNLVGQNDFQAQARQVFANMGAVLREGRATFESIVKLTVYLTDMSKLPEFGRIKAEFIPGAQPASTAIEIAALAVPGMMIEVEAIAVA